MKFITIGTAGHVDHGKTTLINSLTGINTDRLPEEKQRGMSIDLGFSNLKINENLTAYFIDVPGHEKFLKNLLAGITGINFVILVISATEGFMPQTIEHLKILNLLGIKNGIIVISKTDLADKEILELVYDDIYENTKNTPFENFKIIEFSSKKNKGIKEIISEISKFKIIENETNINSYPVLLPIDRVFSKKGIGTIITGTLFKGEIRLNDNLEIPSISKIVKVRNIQTNNIDTDYVTKNQRVALVLSDVSKNEISRGDFLITQEKFNLTDYFDVKLQTINDLKTNTKIKFYFGSSEINGKVLLLDKKVLENNEESFAKIVLDKKIPVYFNGSFIIRKLANNNIIGGGKIINPISKLLGKNNVEKKFLLNLFENEKFIEIFEYLINKNQSNFNFEEYIKIIPFENRHIVIEAENMFIKINNRYISYDYYNNLVKEIKKYILNFHNIYPYKIGILKNDLQRELNIELNILEYIIKNLENSFLTIFENYVFNINREINFINNFDKCRKLILNLLELNTFQTLNDLTSNITMLNETEIIDLLETLEFLGNISRINSDIYLLTNKLKDLIEKLNLFFKDKDKLNVNDAKELFGSSRKYIIPFLEYLDKKKFTIREDNYRIQAKFI